MNYEGIMHLLGEYGSGDLVEAADVLDTLARLHLTVVPATREQPPTHITRPAADPGTYPPLEVGDANVGSICPGCHRPLEVGDIPTMVNPTMVNPTARPPGDRGSYMAWCFPAHERCVRLAAEGRRHSMLCANYDRCPCGWYGWIDDAP